MKKILAIIFAGAFIMAAQAKAMEMDSSTIENNVFMASEQAYSECGGMNISPDLRWFDVPEEAKSLALIVHDPDAPRDFGWYHWIVVDIPPSVTGVEKGAKFDAPARELATDYGVPGYNGPCPPIGHGVHHYHFMLYALDVEELDLTPDMKPHEIDATVKASSLAQATITGLYERE
ncbi:MAG: YbhB/YbcL family Raf kinase inhibitor-like protein [Alphaproteobacteria bacterium]|nr:YbhB/YbcL family Raf kinase inhibitor-like protein [Alphaproteobacteria bacterium]